MWNVDKEASVTLIVHVNDNKLRSYVQMWSTGGLPSMSIIMPTLQPVVAPQQYEQSLLVEKDRMFFEIHFHH